MRPTRTLATGVIAALLLSAVPSLATAAESPTEPHGTTTTIAPSGDQYVQAGGSNATRSFVTDKLVVGGGRDAVLRFDLDSLPEDSVVAGATLDLYKTSGPSTVIVVSEIEETWTSSVTSSTMPARRAELTRASVGGAGSWYSFDLAAAVRKAAADRADLSLHLTRSAAQNASEFFSSRGPDATKQPKLTVTSFDVADVVAADYDELDGLAEDPLYTDLSLPSEGSHGSGITWTSSDEAVVTAAGVITRPSTATDATAVLTATITAGDSVRTREFPVTVRGTYEVTPSHPQSYTSDAEKPALLSKIASESWAQESLANLEAAIDPLADRHVTDPDWILSRMGMFWKDGEHYTQVYITAERFDRAEGDAPVPTLRYPAMRIWNDNKNAPLEDRIPYSEDGSMMNQNGVVVPYTETGHMVRLNNEEILTLAQKAAFLYHVTDDQKYAKFASDIYQQWLLGVYYMNPALDPDESLGGPGGYAPGGIGGYYDYEVIHDPMGGIAGTVFDFLYDYLNEHQDPRIADTGKDLNAVSSEVLKRFIDIGIVRGGFEGNWNVNGWGCILPAIVALESNDYYPDGKGKEHYLKLYTSKTTQYHQSLPDILSGYDEVTGLWHESPGYAFGTVNILLDYSVPVGRAGFDTIADSPILQKAALAQIPWLDARGNTVVFGDGRGGPISYTTFERLNSYYEEQGDTANAARVSQVVRNAVDAGQYSRSTLGWLDILDNAPLAASDSGADDTRTAYSEHHQHITMKNGNDPADGMMATLYGGVTGDHLNANGLAAQIYAKGWAIAPNAKSYESYWTDDYAYSSGPAGANTVVPGYTTGPVTVNAMEPAPAKGGFTNDSAISASQQFSDVSAAEKRRQLALVRTSPTTGFYVDVFRSDQEDNDYLWHNLGDGVQLLDAEGEPIATTPTESLGTANDPAYTYFTDTESAAVTDDVRARWTIDGDADQPDLVTDMWMLAQDGRTVYTAEGLPTTILSSLTPGGVNTAPDTTPTVIVRQEGNNAESAPFASVFEAYEEGENAVQDIADFGSDGAFVGLKVSSDGEGGLDGRTDTVLSSADDAEHTPADGVLFQGKYGVATENAPGFVSLYLGSGTQLASGSYGIRAGSGATVAAGLEATDDGLQYSADAEITVKVPYTATGAEVSDVRLQYRSGDEWLDAAGGVSADGSSLSGAVPAGSAVALRASDAGWNAPDGSATAAPGIGTLSNTSGHETGLSDGNYSVDMNLWWGQNATTYELFENGTLVHTERLTAATPSAQKVVVPISGRPNGTYVYTGVLSNRFGSTATSSTTVTVQDASPGIGVLSNDNWDGDGGYAVTFDLWWGTNGTDYTLFENGSPVDTRTLTAATPGAQKVVTTISGKPAGRYVYQAELANVAGSTSTREMTVTVQ
ncbi:MULTISPECIES: immunoglobulin-like domain-containing protein [unclassified Rathayibacter]|uniref:immunoglobulin-like domain-containing protein n=1 Tax=unclassified Rathayibacter TaxID=2609250 RepID=UPI000FB39032|nr:MULTISPECIES: immunoglobulin-like domain-containing protein [unclassified Rathayibacter]ROP49110.1 hypothetical protein EDF45_2441 [Rathayibacter sp. PhB186]ROS50773.1 hypothetical protein EDF44_2607 [Rathayibacter sp. PhB185]